MSLQAGDLVTVRTQTNALPARYVQALAGTPNHQVQFIYPTPGPERLAFPVVVYGANIEKATICRSCGCSDFFACEGGCSWVEIDLCSSCA